MTAEEEFITPKALYSMNDDAIEDMLEQLRDRRLSAVRLHEQALKAAQEAADEKARLSLFKQCEMATGNITRVDKALDALEKRINKIRALRLELGLD